MSFASELDACGEVMSHEIIAKSNFMESEPKECAAPSKQETVEESLVKHCNIVITSKVS